MEDWQLETLVAALLAGPRAPDIVDKFEYILSQIRERGGLRALHEKAGLPSLKGKIDGAGSPSRQVSLTQKF